MAERRYIPKKYIPPSPQLPRVEKDIPLTKTVQGQKASDLEERFYRAMRRLNREVVFQYIIPAFDGAPIANLPGEVHLDFVDCTDIIRPFQVDDVEFIHKGAEAIAEDVKDDIRVNQFFSKYGEAAPVVRVPGNYLQTQEMADAYVTNLVSGLMLAQKEGVIAPPESIAAASDTGVTLQAPPEMPQIYYPYTEPVNPEAPPPEYLNQVEEDVTTASELQAQIDELRRALKEQQDKNLTQDALLAGIFKDNNIVQRVSQVADDLGDMRAGRFLALSDGIEPAIDGTGAFMSARGETFGSSKYHIGGVNAGALQFGVTATDGTAIAGGGVVKLDANGISILHTTAYAAQRAVKFIDADGTVGSALYGSASGDNYAAGLFANGPDGTSSVAISADRGDAGSVSLTLSNSSVAAATHATIDGGDHTLRVGTDGLQIDGAGATITTFSTDGTLAANSDDYLPTEKAVKTYVDAQSGGSNSICDGRLTLTTAVPVTTADVTAATTVYYTPYVGEYIALYDGSTAWDVVEFSEISIKLTDTQTGTTHNGTAVIDGLTDTSQLIVGMAVTGTGVGASAVISSIDSATQVTVDVNSTADGTVSITFKVPASKMLDIWCFNNSGTAKLEMTAWTNDTTRATAIAKQDGVYIKSGTTTRRYIGSVRTTATAGQTEDSFQYRLVYNYYNRRHRELHSPAGGSHSYSSTTARPFNNDSTIRTGFVQGVAEDAIETGIQSDSIPVNAGLYIGVDSTSVVDYLHSANVVHFDAELVLTVGLTRIETTAGYHYLQLLERAWASVTFGAAAAGGGFYA